MFTHHYGRHNGLMQVNICFCRPCPSLYICSLFFFRMIASTSRNNAWCHTVGSVRVWFEEYQDEFTILPWLPNSPDLNSIENLWDHLDWVCNMDPYPCNLEQLTTVLELAWLNIPVNSFRNLIDSLPVYLAAVCSAKSGYYSFWQVATLMGLDCVIHTDYGL